ncbi:hypothetical protein HY632_00355 [Candidatus Uhrbacteria bacterium]|nr:hypothetical protein [Candidatus Uhrbacteria bacterium]
MKVRLTPRQIDGMSDLDLIKAAEGLEIIGVHTMDVERLRGEVVERARVRGILDDDGVPVRPSVKPIKFTYPGIETTIPIPEGRNVTLGDVLDQVKSDYTLDPQTRYYVNGDPVNMTGDGWRAMRMEAGMRVEGTRPAGEKGIA